MASSNQPENRDDSTFTAMSLADVEAIGALCQMPFCHQLDFLPFRCESCKGKFCLDHRTETAHSCTHAGAWARARTQQANASYKSTPKPTVLTHEQQCSDPSCKTLINTPLVSGVHCPNCRREYCLKHRLREEHGCEKLTPVRPGQAQKERGMAALDKLRAWGAAKKVSIPQTRTKSEAAARLQATTTLKKTAKGDDKVPVDKRVYVHVEASSETISAKIPKGAFFYNKEWSVGRVLDLAAKSLQVQNLNNRAEGEEQKLRVFHVEGGRLLEFSDKLGTAVQTGNTIVLLRGVGPPVPDLLG